MQTPRFTVLVFLLTAAPLPAQEEIAEYAVEVDLGEDFGQSFGSLFEVQDADGNVVAGAGFPDTYNTRFRTGRHMIQFHIRSAAGKQFQLERLPHPDLDCGVYLFDYEGSVYAWSSIRGNVVVRWDGNSRKWIPENPPGIRRLVSGDGVMRLGRGRLTFTESQAWYGDQRILSAPEAGRYYCFYYADGHLFFYHMVRTDTDSFTRILACPWTPGQAAVDPDRAVVLTAKYEQETPFAWGQYAGQILTVSNQGGLYVFEDGEWRTVLESDDQVSYQVYSALHWHDRLLLAQYPTGNVFEYRGKQAVHVRNWPPVPSGVSTRARECQTLGIYSGDLLAGVWPWAELWRYDRGDKEWIGMGRAFTHPELTAEQTHPYEAAANRLGLVTNHWGQRITSMIPQGDALFLSTSSKGTAGWKSEYRFLSDTQRREYGAVLRLRMPGNLAVQMHWKSEPVRLKFQVGKTRMSIYQDGERLGSVALPAGFGNVVSGGQVVWGRGVYGPLRGTLVSRKAAQ